MASDWDRRSVLWLTAGLGLASTSSGATLVARALDGLFGDDTPPKVAAIYWTRWNSSVPLRSVPTSYNVIYLFAATRGYPVGEMTWEQQTDLAAEVRHCRARGQRVVLSLGGSGQGVPFTTRTECERLVASVVRIDAELGGTIHAPAIDGVDFNTFEDGVAAYASLYIWMAEELRRRFGSGFGISCPPAPTSARDRRFCRALLSAGAMDYVAPQFYDGPGLADPDVIVRETRAWVDEVADGDASRIVVGFGMDDLPDYSSMAEIAVAWARILAEHPRIGGAYLWQHRTDAAGGWPFAQRMAPGIAAGHRSVRGSW